MYTPWMHEIVFLWKCDLAATMAVDLHRWDAMEEMGHLISKFKIARRGTHDLHFPAQGWHWHKSRWKCNSFNHMHMKIIWIHLRPSWFEKEWQPASQKQIAIVGNNRGMVTGACFAIRPECKEKWFLKNPTRMLLQIARFVRFFFVTARAQSHICIIPSWCTFSFIMWFVCASSLALCLNVVPEWLRPWLVGFTYFEKRILQSSYLFGSMFSGLPGPMNSFVEKHSAHAYFTWRGLRQKISKWKCVPKHVLVHPCNQSIMLQTCAAIVLTTYIMAWHNITETGHDLAWHGTTWFEFISARHPD